MWTKMHLSTIRIHFNFGLDWLLSSMLFSILLTYRLHPGWCACAVQHDFNKPKIRETTRQDLISKEYRCIVVRMRNSIPFIKIKARKPWSCIFLSSVCSGMLDRNIGSDICLLYLAHPIPQMFGRAVLKTISTGLNANEIDIIARVLFNNRDGFSVSIGNGTGNITEPRISTNSQQRTSDFDSCSVYREHTWLGKGEVTGWRSG